MGRTKKKVEHRNYARGCIECGLRYEDRWEPPEINGLCQTCRRGHSKMDSELAQFPRDCCWLNARPVRKDERERLRLGGPPDMPWYICDGETGNCHRTFPYTSPAHSPWIWEKTPATNEELKREHDKRSRYAGH